MDYRGRVFYQSVIYQSVAPDLLSSGIRSEKLTLENVNNPRIINYNNCNESFDIEQYFEDFCHGVLNEADSYFKGRKRFEIWNSHIKECDHPDIVENPPTDAYVSYIHGKISFATWKIHMMKTQSEIIEEPPKETPLTVSDRFSKIAKLKVRPLKFGLDDIPSTPLCRHTPGDYSMRFKAKRVLFPSDSETERNLIRELEQEES